MKKLPVFCGECGKKLLIRSEKASNIKIWKRDDVGGDLVRLDCPFDSQTGLENMASSATCPDYKKSFLFVPNIHSKKIIIHDKAVLYKDDLYWL